METPSRVIVETRKMYTFSLHLIFREMYVLGFCMHVSLENPGASIPNYGNKTGL